jgi:hypothetical protein
MNKVSAAIIILQIAFTKISYCEYIYWTSESVELRGDSIYRTNINTKETETLWTPQVTDGYYYIQDLNVDLDNSLIFFIQIFATHDTPLSYVPGTCSIKIINLDGSNEKTIKPSYVPNEITLDTFQRVLYYIGVEDNGGAFGGPSPHRQQSIRKISYNGTNEDLVLNSPSIPITHSNPISKDITNLTYEPEFNRLFFRYYYYYTGMTDLGQASPMSNSTLRSINSNGSGELIIIHKQILNSFSLNTRSKIIYLWNGDIKKSNYNGDPIELINTNNSSLGNLGNLAIRPGDIQVKDSNKRLYLRITKFPIDEPSRSELISINEDGTNEETVISDKYVKSFSTGTKSNNPPVTPSTEIFSGWNWGDEYPWMYNSIEGWLYLLPTDSGLWIYNHTKGTWNRK